MFHLNNIKTILVHALYITGTIFLVTSCSENRAVDSKEIAERTNIAAMEVDSNTILVVENDNDAEFMMEVAEMQIEEISLGKLAQQKGNTSHVKALGKMMENDHSKTLTELRELALTKSVSLPTSITEDSQETYIELNKKTGNDFGRAYSDMMVEHHKDAIDLFEKTSTSSEDSQIRLWASNKLEGLRNHLKHAEACKKECDKM